MARLSVLLLVLSVLAGCATPAERAARMEREVERMIQIYGPACSKLGYKSDTDPWRDCILSLNDQENMLRYSTRPMTTTCFGHRGFYQCSSF